MMDTRSHKRKREILIFNSRSLTSGDHQQKIYTLGVFFICHNQSRRLFLYMCCSGSRDILMQNILCFTSSQDSPRAHLTQSRHLNPPWGVWRGQDLWSWCRTSDISLISRNRIGLRALLSHKSGLCVDDPGVEADRFQQTTRIFCCSDVSAQQTLG